MKFRRLADRLPAWRTDVAWDRLAAAAVLATLVALGAVLADDFGESWDERGTARLGRTALQSYQTGEAVAPGGDLARHGPAASAAVEWGIGRLARLAPGWTEFDSRHFVLYLFFVAGLACTYGLARRWVGRGPAVAAVAIMGTQPVLFGHGFINPNDIPFLTLFCAAMLSGLWLADAVDRRGGAVVHAATWRDLKQDWEGAGPGHRRALALWAIVFAFAALDLLVLQKAVLPLLRGWVYAAYTGQAWGLVNDLFRRVAEDASGAPVEAYYERLWLFYSSWRWVVLSLLALPGVPLVRKTLPTLAGSWARISLVRAFVSGILLGLASAVRLIAPLAGVLVSMLAIVRGGRGSLRSLALMWATAIGVTYLAWPVLWGSPIEAYRQYLSKTFLVPFDAKVLYEGRIWLLEVERTPWYYLPSFPILQTTLPALVLMAVGAWSAVARPVRAARGEVHGVALWALLPPATAIVLGSTTYDNARHFLFLQPGLYLFCSLGLERGFGWARRDWMRAVLLAAALLPGIVAIGRLHPYEYAYFNELAGGVRGAFRRYELDYWALSYRELAEYVNREAPQAAVVMAAGPVHVFGTYARQDLQVFPAEPPDRPEDVTPQFAVMTTRSNQDLVLFPEAPVVFRVEVGGAVLAVVKDLR